MQITENDNLINRKDFIGDIHRMSECVEEALSALYKAFLYHREEFLQEAELCIQMIKDRQRPLTERLISVSDTDRIAMRYATVPVNLERMAHNLEHIERAIQTKIKEALLFSDKAVSELNYLFYRLKEVMTALEDMILARNIYLANYIKESEKEIERAASAYATAHEDRLVQGLCMQKSSGVYLIILDALKRIAWNAREIAERLAKR